MDPTSPVTELPAPPAPPAELPNGEPAALAGGTCTEQDIGAGVPGCTKP